MVNAVEYISLLFNLWMAVFIGSAGMPGMIGIMVNSVHKSEQAFSTSFSNTVYNLFGFFLSPTISSCIMDLFDDPVRGLEIGFSIVCYGSVAIVIGMIMVC